MKSLVLSTSIPAALPSFSLFIFAVSVFFIRSFFFFLAFTAPLFHSFFPPLLQSTASYVFSVGPSVRRSVRWSVRWSVTHFFEYAKTRVFDFGRWIGVGDSEGRARTHRQTDTHARPRNFAAKTSDGARAAVPRDASYVWRDQTCFLLRCSHWTNTISPGEILSSKLFFMRKPVDPRFSFIWTYAKVIQSTWLSGDEFLILKWYEIIMNNEGIHVQSNGQFIL